MPLGPKRPRIGVNADNPSGSKSFVVFLIGCIACDTDAALAQLLTVQRTKHKTLPDLL